jgi:hypothetical protein
MHSHGKTAVLFGGRECCEVMVKNLMHPKILLSQETIILNISPDPNASFFLFFFMILNLFFIMTCTTPEMTGNQHYWNIRETLISFVTRGTLFRSY